MIATDGPLVSTILATVTFTAADVAAFPAMSTAKAVKACAPVTTLAVFHEIEYGDVVSAAPMFTPSTRNCTLATPDESDAVAVSVTVPATWPAAGAVIATDGPLLSTVT